MRTLEHPSWRPIATLITVVVTFALFPLVRERSFYYWDDTAAVFVPTWRAIGLDLWAGHWPTLRPDLWMGGNWAAEAQFGLWSPANLLAALVLSQISHLALAAALAKVGAMLLLTSGAYLLFRHYGASPWVSVAVASALPFAGFTLYFDAATWVAGLLAYAWTPWFWWVARRCLLGANCLPVYVVGYLVVANGNPYGVVAILFVLVGLAAEAVVTRQLPGLRRLVMVGACVGTVAAVVYLPMMATAASGWRGEVAGVSNTNELAPDLTMLAATSTASMLPLLNMWGQHGSSVPATYTVWFLLPMLVWLKWAGLRGRLRQFTTVFVVGGLFLTLALGPSELWLFRWPVRLVQYVFLASSVLFAVLVSEGLRMDAWRSRLFASLGVVVLGSGLALAARPDLLGRHLVGAILVGGLVCGVVSAARYKPGAVPAVLLAGTGLVLALQLVWVPANLDVMVWRAPTRVAAFEQYAASHPGPVVQIAVADLIPVDQRTAAASELLFGSQSAIAQVESTTSYTGIGFDAFSRTLCLNFAGNSCPQAFPVAWQPAGSLVRTPTLLDAVKARTFVVQRALVPEAAEFSAPTGWQRSTGDHAIVFERTTQIPWPQSRLAAASGDLTVISAQGTSTKESVVVSTGSGGGALQFARLVWPGYRASLDGDEVDVTENAQGLMEIAIPPGIREATLSVRFSPPGFGIGIPLLVAGAVGAAVLGGLDLVLTRRSGYSPRRARAEALR